MIEKPRPEQTVEWFESPVTEYFRDLVRGVLTEIKAELSDQGWDTAGANELQSRRANLWGMRSALETVEQVFESQSFDELEEEEDGESVGDTSPRGSGTH